MTAFQSNIQARIVRFKVDRLRLLQQRIRESLGIERQEINRQVERCGVTEVEHLESLRDDLVMVGQMEETALQLTFVGLYSVVELRLKALLERHIEALVNTNVITSRCAKNVYKIDNAKQFLNDHFNIDLTRVRNFEALDETRLINNSVKHNGVVSRQLAEAFPRWQQGQPLSGLARALNRLAPRVAPFFEDLARKLPNPPPRAPANPMLPA